MKYMTAEEKIIEDLWAKEWDARKKSGAHIQCDKSSFFSGFRAAIQKAIGITGLQMDPESTIRELQKYLKDTK